MDNFFPFPSLYKTRGDERATGTSEHETAALLARKCAIGMLGGRPLPSEVLG